MCGWTGRFGRRLGGRTSFFVFPEAFPLVIIFLTLLPISIPKPPSPPPSHPLSCSGRATFLSGRLTTSLPYLLPTPLFLPWCCCLYILRLLQTSVFFPSSPSTFLHCPTSLRLHSFDKLQQLLILFNHLIFFQPSVSHHPPNKSPTSCLLPLPNLSMSTRLPLPLLLYVSLLTQHPK